MYPTQIRNTISSAKRPALEREPDASGRAVTFVCGVFIEFELSIYDITGAMEEAVFRTNGCGYVVAAADLIARSIRGAKLTELHGLHDLEKELREKLGEAPEGRQHCFEICFAALQKALADYRLKRIEGWNGEEALVCSCFGVSESRIESVIESENLSTVDEVGASCNAGTGCGSCQPIIQEILDS